MYERKNKQLRPITLVILMCDHNILLFFPHIPLKKYIHYFFIFDCFPLFEIQIILDALSLKKFYWKKTYVYAQKRRNYLGKNIKFTETNKRISYIFYLLKKLSENGQNGEKKSENKKGITPMTIITDDYQFKGCCYHCDN